ncbi:uncharacterized protein CLUP02_15271 [Colletotrichum lupini]|uniref:Secreted protein n=1 Tax=Colletotrichum lupini TaxID=145971 RepID=A0A9Q8T6J3_9PEZI|nr:uncharacterized protein CLUP02_15271 [Colletotrichum lupini]UQC89740.1 hypothetical protein CLUP02_15271 [Colletotrichum lupini]
MSFRLFFLTLSPAVSLFLRHILTDNPPVNVLLAPEPVAGRWEGLQQAVTATARSRASRKSAPAVLQISDKGPPSPSARVTRVTVSPELLTGSIRRNHGNANHDWRGRRHGLSSPNKAASVLPASGTNGRGSWLGRRTKGGGGVPSLVEGSFLFSGSSHPPLVVVA